MGYETDPENDIYEIKKKYEKIRNFSYPFTVCTVDQLFLFSLRPLGSELMAATLSYSKVIIDEIQAYDPKLLAKILFGLDIVNRLKGKFMIMTATLPPFIKDFFVKKNIDCHITPTFFTDMIRHIFCVEKDFNYEFIKQKAKDNKILIICNTVSKSQQVFKDLKQYGLTLNLLHSRFILRDRKQKEEEILKFAPSINYVANNGVWITTQLVEASLDIDFDMLFTEMSTADSLLQRMGRCHRNRDYTHHVSNVYIYDTRNGVGSVYDEDIYQRSLDFLGAYADKPFLEEDKQKYINQVYDINGIKETKYYKNFDKEREKLEDLKNGFLDKKLAQKAFREIESVAVIPFKFADEARVLEQEISDLVKKDERDFLKISKLKENLRDLTLSINPYSTKRYKLSREKILDYPICLNQYCEDIGLIDYDQTDNAL